MDELIHCTTVVTNVIVQNRLASLALPSAFTQAVEYRWYARIQPV